MSTSNASARSGYSREWGAQEKRRLDFSSWCERHGDIVLVGTIVVGLIVSLLGGCIQARAPGSTASLILFSSRFVATGSATNVELTVEGGASPATTATIPFK
jgi:hypothetical protein